MKSVMEQEDRILYKTAYAPNEDLDQPAYLRSLIRALAVCCG